MVIPQKYPTNRQNIDAENESILAYHYPVESTNIEFLGVFMKRNDSFAQIKQPQNPTSTKWKTSQKPRFKELLEKFTSKVAEVPHVARVEYEKKSDEELNIWVLTEDRDMELRKQIYEAEKEMIIDFSDINCNFRVIPDPTKTSPNTTTIYQK